MFKKIFKIQLFFALLLTMSCNAEIFSQSAIRGFIQSVSLEKKETWVFILGGQSNMRPNTADTGTSNTEEYPIDYLQWGRFGVDNNTLIQATKPLNHWSNNYEPDFGPGMITRFANRMKVAFPNVTIVFIPCAQGGTGFGNNSWNKGDTNYEDMITRTNLCLSENPTFKLKGLLWHQGEEDINNASYQTQFMQFNTDWRTDILKADNTTPFVCGGMLPDYINTYASALTLNNFLADIPNNINYSGFASSTSPTILTGHDYVHFNSDSSLILGDRYFEAYLTALNNN